MTAVSEWDCLKGKFRSLPFFLIWEVWLGRNRLIFENSPFQIQQIYYAIVKWMDDRPITASPIQDLSFRLRPHEVNLPAVYFDGACMNGIMGCGTWIKISKRERVHIHFNAGMGTNNKAEIIALWGGLRFAIYLQLMDIHVYGDSRIAIGWISNPQASVPTGLHGWVSRVRRLWYMLNRPALHHIYRDNNTRADGLSKMGIFSDYGTMQVQLFRDGIIHWETEIDIP